MRYSATPRKRRRALRVRISRMNWGPEPRAERAMLSSEAVVRLGLKRVSVDVVDLSLSGVKLGMLDPIEVGARLWLKLPMLEGLEVRVVWYRNFEAGCEFVNPLHPAVAKTIVARAA